MPAAWQAGPPQSEITFTLRHLVFTEIAGRVGRWHASLRLDYTEPTRSSVDVVVDAGSLETGAVERDNHVRSNEFLDIRSFPEIRFRSRQVRRGDGEGRFLVTGDLTIRDVTREVTLLVESPHGGGRPERGSTLAFTAHATVDRQEFGLRWNQDLDRGGVIAGDKVDLQIRIEARKAAKRA